MTFKIATGGSIHHNRGVPRNHADGKLGKKSSTSGQDSRCGGE